MKVKIIQIDMSGFCGRDNHPRKTDLGKTGIAFKVQSESYVGCVPVDADEILKNPAMVMDENFYMHTSYEVMMSDGTVRTMMDFEIEKITE